MVVAAAVYLVGNASVGLWDRDEPRNAMTAREMLRSGDWVVPRLYDEPRTAKPPLAFWLMAAAMKGLGENPFAARLPAAAAMVVTLGVVGAAAWRVAGPRRESATGPRQVLMLDYKEPSVAFYQGGTIRDDPAAQLTAEHLERGTPWFVVTAGVWDKTRPDVRERFNVVDRIRGFAYAGGREVEVLILRSRAAGRGT